MIEDEESPAVAGEQPAVASKDAQPQSADHNGAKPAQGAPGPMNGADFQAYIGRGLRAVFDDVAKQPVPDRFLELMNKLG